MDKTYRFLPYFFTAFLGLIVYCFYQSYFSKFPDFQDVISPIGNVPIAITTVTHFHALMLMSWLLMLIVQPVLIVRRQFQWHKWVGKASYVVVVLMVVSLLLIINQEQSREKSLPVFAANLFDVPVFLVFYGLAIYYRRKPAYHARFMVMSIVPFINPALARLLANGLAVQWGVWVLLLAVEFFTRKTYKPYLIGLGYYLLNLAVVAYLFIANQPLLDTIWHVFF
jgi:hypothetical protein